jgi:anti-sigma-K factor RskA
MTDIDWKAELRKFEREFEGLPPEPSPAELRERRLAEEEERRRHDAINDGASAWLRLILVIALAVAVQFWPYARVCGLGVSEFVGVEAAVILGGLWVTIHSWRRQVASAHVVAFAIVLYGVAMISLEVLPRTGYAKPDPARPARWSCAERPVSGKG